MKVVKPKRKAPKPWWVKVIIILTIIAFIIITLNIVISYIASKKIRSAFEKNKYGLSIDMDYARVNILTRSIKLAGLSVNPDTAVPEFNIEIEKIKLSGIGIIKILSGDGANIGLVYLEEPVFKGNFDYLLDLMTHKKADSSNSSSKPFAVFIHKIILEKAKMDSVIMPGVFPFQDVSSLDLEIMDVHLKMSDGKTTYDIGDAKLDIEKSKFLIPGEYYNIEFFRFNLNFQDSLIGIDSFRLIPNYGFYEFGEKKGLQTDRFVVGVDKLSLMGFDFNNAIHNKGIFADDMLIQKLYLKVFRDKRIPFDYDNYPPLPQQALNKLKFPLNIKQATISNMFVEYSEINNVSDKPGFVRISDLNITLENIANRLSKSAKADFVVNGSGLLYGSGKISAEYIFPIYAVNDTFFFNGTAENFEMSQLNQMVTPLTNVEVTAGILHKATFSGSANPVYSGGTFEMLYNDLSFNILKEEVKDQPEKTKSFITFLAKSVIRSNNPIGNKDPKVVSMFFKRDPNKGFFNFYWKSILSGIKNTALPGNQVKTQDDILPPKTKAEKKEAKKEARKEEKALKKIKN
ncbi:hypothetical protein ACFLRY_05455 [Bacteroidota bacterium]